MPLPPDHAGANGIPPVRPSRLGLAAAFVTLYFVWGSTYLAIRIAVETVPPFTLSGARFVAAGVALILWRHFRADVPLPTPRQWLGAGGVGACLVLLSNVSIVWAERKLASGVVALFAAGTPLLIALFNGRRTRTRLNRRRAIGLGLGTGGMALLASATFAAVHEYPPLLLLALASSSWAIGSTYGRDWGQPPDLLMASAAQMLVGGSLALLAAIASGDLGQLHAHSISAPSAVAWAYLALVGSLIAYPVFQWLLSVADATAVASYTYVNPIVAVALGVTFAHEVVTPRMLVATAVLIPAVVLVVTGGSRPELEVKEEQ